MSMATAGSLRGIGVPVKLLHEAEGHVVTVGVLLCSAWEMEYIAT